jgi:DNA-binding transcriptional MerR regulator
MGVPLDDRRHLSIGEVLGLLLEEFPDITISKIRFLESQGLIEPERTPSGYRKFYDADVERLRVILREQREHYLPLKVIKDRLEAGELGNGDPTPAGVVRFPPRDGDRAGATHPDPRSLHDAAAGHPAAGRVGDAPDGDGSSPPAPPTPALPSVLTVDELCEHAGITASFLAELESYGIIAARPPGAARLYDADTVRAVVAAAGLCRRGLEPRHLRAWRTAVDKELSLIEQLAGPLLRQRQPRSHEEARELATAVESLGSELRSALARIGLRQLVP